jgi:hypothetical protein
VVVSKDLHGVLRGFLLMHDCGDDVTCRTWKGNGQKGTKKC